jgi:hypothetical protein
MLMMDISSKYILDNLIKSWQDEIKKKSMPWDGLRLRTKSLG